MRGPTDSNLGWGEHVSMLGGGAGGDGSVSKEHAMHASRSKFDHQNSCQKWGRVVCVCNHWARKAEAVGSLGAQ